MSGELYHTPAEIIAQMFVDLGLADYPEDDGLTGWVVYPMHLPETPDEAILISDTAGRLHRRMHVSGITGEHYGIQILVRSPEDPATPYKKVKSILHYLDTEVNRELVTISGHTYRVNAVTRTSGALPAGRDGARFLYSGNVVASIEFVEADTGTGT